MEIPSEPVISQEKPLSPIDVKPIVNESQVELLFSQKENIDRLEILLEGEFDEVSAKFVEPEQVKSVEPIVVDLPETVEDKESLDVEEQLPVEGIDVNKTGFCLSLTWEVLDRKVTWTDTHKQDLSYFLKLGRMLHIISATSTLLSS